MNDQAKTPVWNQVMAELAANWGPEQWRGLGVVIGCSGGADSVALLRAVEQLRCEQDAARGFLVVAHFNHRVRGEESDGDEQFVRALADQLDVLFEVQRGDGKVCDEATMRNQRLEFLVAVAKRHGARYIAVAHSADDNVETVLHHLMRGTGPRGLAGIAPHRSLDGDFVLIRPLLSANRSALRNGLRELQQEWREDSSNENTDYRRNWIRQKLMPLIESEYPHATAALRRAIEAQRDWCESIDRQANQWLQRHWIDAGQTVLQRDVDSDPAIVVAALQQLWDQRGWPRQEMARQHWLRLERSISGSQIERYSLPAGVDVTVDSDRISIIRRIRLPAE